MSVESDNQQIANSEVFVIFLSPGAGSGTKNEDLVYFIQESLTFLLPYTVIILEYLHMAQLLNFG